MIEVHGHRGARSLFPENTLPSLEEAARCGAHFAEIDVHFTADDVPVVFHDVAVDHTNAKRFDGRAIERPLPLRRIRAEDLSAFDVGAVPRPRFPRQRHVPGSRIPTLDAVLGWLTRIPSMHLNIELKVEAPTEDEIPDRARFCRAVLGLVASRAMVGRVMVQSFDPAIVFLAARWYPALRTALLVEGRDAAVERAKACSAKGLGPEHTLVDEKLAGQCKSAGLRLVPWTANEERDWTRLVRLGVDGIITDDPRRLLRFLGEK